LVEHDATKAKIVQTLTDVLKNNSLDQITVGTVAEAANISRQTFYYHFNNLTKVYLWAVSSKMRYGLTEYAGLIALDPSEYIIDACNAMKSNYVLTMAFLSSHQVEILDVFRDYFYNASRVSLLYVMGNSAPTKDIELLASFLAGGYVGIVFRWIRGGMKEDIADIIGAIFSICRGTMSTDIVQKIDALQQQ